MTENISGGQRVEDRFELDDEQKRRLRAVRRGYRAQSAEVKDNGYVIEVTFMDGSKVNLNSKLLKLRAEELKGNGED